MNCSGYLGGIVAGEKEQKSKKPFPEQIDSAIGSDGNNPDRSAESYSASDHYHALWNLSTGIVFCPIGLPILSVENTARMSKAIGLTEQSEEKHEIGELPQHYADMFGGKKWEGKKDCFIFAHNYGEAEAVNQLGKKLGLPPAFSGHNNHYFWPPTDYSGNVVIIIGGDIEGHKAIFQEVILSARTDCRHCIPYENNLPIFICRWLTLPMQEFWARKKHFQ